MFDHVSRGGNRRHPPPCSPTLLERQGPQAGRVFLLLLAFPPRRASKRLGGHAVRARMGPCGDSRLRCPQDVFPQPDPARESAPVAELSGDLLSMPDREGVKLGVAIPEATVLQRLLEAGSRLAAEELAVLLREVREQVATEEDGRRFEQAVPELVVRSVDDERTRSPGLRPKRPEPAGRRGPEVRNDGLTLYRRVYYRRQRVGFQSGRGNGGRKHGGANKARSLSGGKDIPPPPPPPRVPGTIQ